MTSLTVLRQCADLEALTFEDLPGWAADRQDEALAAFLRLCQPWAGGRAADAPVRAEIAAAALALPADPGATTARAFFERSFQPFRVRPHEGGGFLTGYFEPDVTGSRTRTDHFRYPLYGRPADLVDITDDNRPSRWDPDIRFVRLTEPGFVPYLDRGEIEDGALDGLGLELCWLADPVDAFLIHVQGSARVRLTDGSFLRVAYAAKAGHPYTSIGRLLIERGLATPESMTLAALRAWLRQHPEAGRALMRENRSYIFFQVLDSAVLDPALGAIAAAGVQITPGRSLAIDHRLHAYGTPIWIDATLPLGPDGNAQPFRRLMIAGDTGSAIVGPARGDIFFGLGETAEAVAGQIRHVPDAFVVLLPRGEG